MPKKKLMKILVVIFILFFIITLLEIILFINYFISYFDKWIKFIILIIFYSIIITILLRIIFNINDFLKIIFNNIPIYNNINSYKSNITFTNEKIIVFYPEELNIKDKKDILTFIKLVTTYNFINKKNLVELISQITIINILIFSFSIFILYFFNNKNYHFIWIAIVSFTYIAYFINWTISFSYQNINKIFQKLYLKPSFRNNLTFYITPLKKAFSLLEIFIYISHSKKKEEEFEKYINLIIQILLPISYIAFLTFYIGFKS